MRVGVVGLLRCVCVGGVSFWVPLRLIHRYLYLFFLIFKKFFYHIIFVCMCVGTRVPYLTIQTLHMSIPPAARFGPAVYP